MTFESSKMVIFLTLMCQNILFWCLSFTKHNPVGRCDVNPNVLIISSLIRIMFSVIMCKAAISIIPTPARVKWEDLVLPSCLAQLLGQAKEFYDKIYDHKVSLHKSWKSEHFLVLVFLVWSII